ncbi:MAG: cupin domain-containing protein [Hahellaceae bacterium]|nr:cupin domain-containing protein [Hahellaceae bacterium]MCP5211480.1 cupin domain-containing protein [Hahellaceae bacterium]
MTEPANNTSSVIHGKACEAKYLPFRPESEYYFQEGCHIIELLNREDDADVSIARARVTPGATTRLHALINTSERYLILQGQGEVFIGGRTTSNGQANSDMEENIAAEPLRQAVAIGDMVIIPPGVPQQITNTGSDDLVFLAICTPRFEVKCYTEIEMSATITPETDLLIDLNKNKGDTL